MSLQWRRRPLLGTPVGWSDAVHPVLRNVYAARGVLTPADAEHRLQRLLRPDGLGGLEAAVALLAEAIRTDAAIVVAGDYDCDGATGTALAVRGLRMLGARRVDYAIPNRFLHGYGLSAALVDTLQPAPQLIVTVDNGVASVEGVAAARARGIRVIVTDHHLPGERLPAADAIVNPNLPGDGFPSKHLAGVGVMFYLLLALRAQLFPQGESAGRAARETDPADRTPPGGRPDLSALLDLVALGTVADLVPLDFNNRVLVEAGLRRIRAGRACPGIGALLELSRREPALLSAADLGFAVAPRINAAGRLQDMRLGVACLLAEDAATARRHAERLDAINQERRALQASMVEEARVRVSADDLAGDAVGVALYERSWHAGVVGLVASQLKERLHRPVIAFAPVDGGETSELRGSGRSIAGFHLRDALALIDARQPGLIVRFGGHAMAAGLTLRREDFPRFAHAFDAVARERLPEEALHAVLHTDGELPPGAFGVDLARQLQAGGPWGQGFPEPLFDNVFDCRRWRLLGDRHWQLELHDPRDGARYDAVLFNPQEAEPPPRLRAAYELVLDTWQGRERLRLRLRHIAPA